jgi:hypothetical protein
MADCGGYHRTDVFVLHRHVTQIGVPERCQQGAADAASRAGRWHASPEGGSRLQHWRGRGRPRAQVRQQPQVQVQQRGMAARHVSRLRSSRPSIGQRLRSRRILVSRIICGSTLLLWQLLRLLLPALQRLHSSPQVADQLLRGYCVRRAFRVLGVFVTHGQQQLAHVLQVLMAVRNQRTGWTGGIMCMVSLPAADAVCRGRRSGCCCAVMTCAAVCSMLAQCCSGGRKQRRSCAPLQAFSGWRALHFI